MSMSPHPATGEGAVAGTRGGQADIKRIRNSWLLGPDPGAAAALRSGGTGHRPHRHHSVSSRGPPRDPDRTSPFLPPSHHRLRPALGSLTRLGLADHPHWLYGGDCPDPRWPGREGLRTSGRLPTPDRLDVPLRSTPPSPGRALLHGSGSHGPDPPHRGTQLPTFDLAPGGRPRRRHHACRLHHFDHGPPRPHLRQRSRPAIPPGQAQCQ